MSDDALAAKKVEESKISQTALHLEYLFDGVDFKNRSITISEDIHEDLFIFVDAAMNEMERVNRKHITIKLNSPGGSVYEALAIVGRMKKSPCNIHTEIYGHTMSAATLIAAAGDVRKMSKYAFFMHHSSSYEVSGRHSEVRATVEQMEREERLWAKWMADLTTPDDEFWYETGKNVDAYFTAEECLELGVVDEVF